VSIEQVVAKALEKNPDERYQQIEELIDDLKSISEGIVPEGIRARLRKAKLLKRKRAFLYASIAGFLIIMTVIALSLFTGRAEAIDSIAVLLFENLSGDPDQEYFSDGITDALINELAKISALRVISRQSMMRYKGSEKPLPEIARELNVDAVVEASVLTVGGRVQIRAQLIQAATEQNLWAQSYERDLSNILILQSEMARAIADEIRVKLTGEEETHLASARQVNPEAYKAYLKGQFHWYKLTPPGLEAALQYFQSALEKDPNYALAHTGIAKVWRGRAQMGLVPPSEAALKAKEAALRALELDSTLAEAHRLLAGMRAWVEWDWEGAEPEFRRAIELNPSSPDALASYSSFLNIIGRSEEAIAQIERAIELDPFNPLFLAWYSVDLLFARRYDDAIAQAQNALRTTPNHPVASFAIQMAYHAKGMYEEALAATKAHWAGLGHREVVDALERGYEEAGYKGAMNLAAETLAADTTYVSPYAIAILYARAGKNDRAFDWLERAVEARVPSTPFLGQPIFDSLRDDPRLKDLRRRMNLPELE
jgi:TolB-like protein/Tfp pilus assembly protein PilF